MRPKYHFVERVEGYSNQADSLIVKKALEFAYRAHDGFFRHNGDQYIKHVIAVANTLVDWHAPAWVIAVGLLHDVALEGYSLLEHDHVLAKIEAAFGKEVAASVHGVWLLGDFHATYPPTWDPGLVTSGEYKLANLPWVIRILNETPYAVVVKFADRLHSFQTQQALSEIQRRRTAVTTMNVFIPLAGRLGMYSVRRTLQDYAFKVLEPDEFAKMADNYEEDRSSNAISPIVEDIHSYLIGCDAKVEVREGPMSLFSAYVRYLEANRVLNPWRQIAPVLVLTENQRECYHVFGLLHERWSCLTDRFKDYISNPKPNGYRAIHTRIRYQPDCNLGIFVRSGDAHLVAEYGITAHWFGVAKDLPPIPSLGQPAPEGTIAVFTNDGDVMLLPSGSTPLDFACKVHSTLIYQCIGALVNGMPFTLTRPLEDGVVVRILAGTGRIQPDPAWLSKVKTPKAKRILNDWFAHENMIEDAQRKPIDLQKPQLNAYLSSTPEHLQDIARYESETVGDQPTKKPHLENKESHDRTIQRFDDSDNLGEPYVVLDQLGQSKSRTVLAKCCKPRPPAIIVGYPSGRKQVTIHRSDCRYVRSAKHIIGARWGISSAAIRVQLNILASNRVGLVRDVARVAAEEKFNILSFQADANEDASAVIHIGLGVVLRSDLDKLITRLKQVESVQEVTVGEPVAPPRFIEGAVVARLIQNPYTLLPVTGDAFFGREGDLSGLIAKLRSLESNESVLLWGPKRIGKTSILKEFIRRFIGVNADFLPIYVDTQGCSGLTTTDFLHKIMLEVEKAVLNPSIRAPRINRVMREPLGYFESFLRQLQRIDQRHIILMVDEFPMLYDLPAVGCTLADIFTYFRSVVQENGRASFIFAGGGILEHLLREERVASFLNVSHKQKVDLMRRVDARPLIERPMTDGSIDLDDKVVERILDLTVGHPYYLQTLCQNLFDLHKQRPVTVAPADFDNFLQDWLLDQTDERFAHFWGSDSGMDFNDQQRNQRLLACIAHTTSQNEWVNSNRLRQRRTLAAIPDDELLNSLKLLTEMDVLEKSAGENYRIRVPLFAQWLPLRFASYGS
ncbi:MAG: HD domain-containing protein [Caldilineaceae bacterium]